ncbi:hypothetical protein F4860DRAFT_462536 [Xylaria cubensis]|nr:hypothetical protein F4860DRAFT_462536 [Xylaria cubensis]
MVASPTPAGIYTLSSILLVTPSIFVCLRYKARRVRSARWGTDDWLILSATLFQLGLAILLYYGAAQRTIGTHTEINRETGGVKQTWHEVEIAKYALIGQILIIFALGMLKSGVIMFYRRIFIGDTFRKVSLATLFLIAFWSIGFFLATILECNGHSPNFLWKSITTFKQQCQKYKYIQLAHAASDVVTDIIILSLPMPSIWRLQMPTSRKILVSLIFVVGFLSVAAGTARLAIVAEDIVETTPAARDVRGVSTNVLVWTYVELGVGIVASCLPTLNPIFEKRSIDSIVASVRSKVSLASLNFKNSDTQKKDTDVPKSLDSVEMHRTDSFSHNHTSRQITETDDIYPLTTVSAE